MKRKEWIPFVSLGVFMAVMNLTIAAFGFERIDRLETRLEVAWRFASRLVWTGSVEERLIGLEQRVSRVEGVLRLRVEQADGDALSEDGRSEEPKG